MRAFPPLPAVLFALSALVLPGCIRLEQHVTLAADGSGSVAFTLLKSPEAADAEVLLESFGSEADGALPAGITELLAQGLTEERARKLFEGEGLRVRDFATKRDAGFEGVAFRVEFSSLRDVVANRRLGRFLVPGLSAGSEKEEAVAVWNPVGTRRSEIEERLVMLEQMEPEVAEEFIEGLRPWFRGMRIRFALTVPGDIVETNLRKVDARTAELVLEASSFGKTADITGFDFGPRRVRFRGASAVPLLASVAATDSRPADSRPAESAPGPRD